jgi:hypothetical protein
MNLLMISITWNSLMNPELKFMQPKEKAPAIPAIIAVTVVAPTTALQGKESTIVTSFVLGYWVMNSSYSVFGSLSAGNIGG